MPKPTSSPVLQFRPGAAAPVAVDIAVARRSERVEMVAPTPALDLSGKPKIVLLIGRGGTGKTTLARYMIEHASGPTLTAALDPVNRTLANYIDGVSQPETSDPVKCARWLRDFLGFSMQGKHPAVIDFGGGDTTLGALLVEVPDLASIVEDAGMALVALYTLAPRIDDLAPFLSLGFQPAATAFVVNDVGDPSRSSNQAFAPLLAQPSVKDAVASGAQVVWMPRLDSEVVSHVETRRLSFRSAAQGASGIGPFSAAQVRTWMRGMDAAFEGVKSWLV